jgi:ATP-binding cassette subfamily B protein AbcA/BmrA
MERDEAERARMRPAEKYEEKASLREFAALIAGTKPSIAALVAAIAISILSTVGGLVVPQFAKGIVNGLSISSIDPAKAVFIALAFLAQAGGSALSGYLLARIGQGVVSRLRERLWRKQLALSVPYFDEVGSGALVSRMANDAAALKSFITDNLASLTSGLIAALGATAFLFSIDWRMSLVILGAIPVATLALFPLGKLMRKVALKTMDENAGLVATLSRALSEIRLVKASNAEDAEYRRGKASIDGLYEVGVREGTVTALVGPAMSIVMMALLVVIVGYGGARVASGAISAGDLVAFVLYILQVVMPVTMLTNALNQLQKARGATQSIIKLLGAPEEASVGEPLLKVDRAIAVEDLRFSYKPGESVLKGISFELEPGSLTAIVGPSGSGKTTIFSLLERFYEPDSGRILLGGEPISRYSLASWRSRIGYVPQDSPLMSGTIRDNLVYGAGRPVTDAEIAEAARMAYADEFILALPAGYDTEVGERGVKLSGGQRQRIAIARALLRDPELLMLDEATSSLDSQAEERVQEAMDNLMRGRTTLVIAHRLSTVVDADRILFLEAGRITGSGSHAELLAGHALYRSFATRQFRLDVEGLPMPA